MKIAFVEGRFNAFITGSRDDGERDLTTGHRVRNENQELGEVQERPQEKRKGISGNVNRTEHHASRDWAIYSMQGTCSTCPGEQSA